MTGLSRVTQPLQPHGSDVVLEATSVPRFFWAIRLDSKHPPGRRLFLATNQPEPEPVVHDDGKGPVLLGAEQGAFSLDRQTGDIIARVTDLTDVVLMKALSTGDVLVLATDQLLAFSPWGEVRWRQTLPDVIDEVAEGGDFTLIVDTTDGVRHHLDTRSGRRRQVTSGAT